MPIRVLTDILSVWRDSNPQSVFISAAGFEPTLYTISKHRPVYRQSGTRTHTSFRTRDSHSREATRLLHLTLCYRYGETRTPNPFRARTSQARMYTFHHIPLYYRPEGTRTPNPYLSRPPGLSRCCIPIPITDRF